jgi:gliding motility-associated-like protein
MRISAFFVYLTCFFTQALMKFSKYILPLLFSFGFKAQPIAIPKNGWTVKVPFEQKNFIENMGQFDLSKEFPKHKILFEAYTEGVHYYLSNKGLILMKYIKAGNTEEEIESRLKKIGIKEEKGNGKKEFKYHTENKYELIEFGNSLPDAEILLGEKVSNYYTYNNPVDKSGIKAYAYKTVTYKNIYTNIDLVFEFLSDTTGIKYSFILHPGASANDIKLIFPKKADLKIDKAGNLLMNTKAGIFMHHTPKTFTRERYIPINCNYQITGNIVQFEVANYNNQETLIIDPWVQNPNMPGSNRAFDVDYDNYGNVYVYGGDYPFKLLKYNSSGVLLWSYLSSLFDYYGDFAVDVNSGSIYLVEGGNFTGAQVQKLNQGGIPVAYLPGDLNKFEEMWRIAFSRCTNQAVIGGGGTTANYQTCYLDTNLTTLTPVNYMGATTCCHDIRSVALDNYGNCYQISCWTTSDSSFSNSLIKLPLPNLNPPIYSVSTGYSFQELGANFYYTTLANNGYNGITTSNTNVYTYDSYVLKKWNGTTGAQTNYKRVHYPNLGWDSIHIYSGGLSSDDCDHIFLGDSNLVRQYDSSLNLIATYIMPDTIYDVKLGNHSNVCVCGAGFVSSFSVSLPSCNYSSLNIATNVTNPTCNTVGSATVTVSSGTPPFTVIWGTSPAQTGTVVTNLQAGIYTVSVTDNSCLKQTKIDTIVITGSAAGTYSSTSVTQNIVCNGDSTGSIYITTNGGVSPYTFNWSNGQNGIGLNSIGNLSAGTYSVHITDNNNCVNNLVVTITQSPPITSTITSGTIKCNGDTVSLSVAASNGHKPYAFLWNTSSTSPIIHNIQAGTYSVSITDSLGCMQTANYILTQPSILNSIIKKSDCKATSVSYIKVNTIGGTSPYTYNWDTNPPQTTDSIFNLSPGAYSVIVMDGNQCKIILKENIYFDLQVLTTVNIFTPNGDNRNETFFPFEYNNSSISTFLSSFDNYELFIYDRWGKLVFNTTDPSNTWGGKDTNGNTCSEGVYYWVISLNSKCHNNSKQTFKGFVHLEK